ncbi:hypothetical protein ENBRE01_1853 [Enteropsectra breve]|nr:hypothetical protein ENBRE01_1853 [Enteropsectra breve]
MRISDLFAICFAVSAGTFDQRRLPPCSLDPREDSIGECFIHMLDKLLHKDAIGDKDSQENILSLFSYQDYAECYEISLKEGLESNYISVLKYFCDCFLYNIRTSNGNLVYRGNRDTIPRVFINDEFNQHPINYAVIFETNFNIVLNTSSYNHKGPTEEVNKNTVKYRPLLHCNSVGNQAATRQKSGIFKNSGRRVVDSIVTGLEYTGAGLLYFVFVMGWVVVILCGSIGIFFGMGEEDPPVTTPSPEKTLTKEESCQTYGS